QRLLSVRYRIHALLTFALDPVGIAPVLKSLHRLLREQACAARVFERVCHRSRRLCFRLRMAGDTSLRGFAAGLRTSLRLTAKQGGLDREQREEPPGPQIHTSERSAGYAIRLTPDVHHGARGGNEVRFPDVVPLFFASHHAVNEVEQLGIACP